MNYYKRVIELITESILINEKGRGFGSNLPRYELEGARSDNAGLTDKQRYLEHRKRRGVKGAKPPLGNVGGYSHPEGTTEHKKNMAKSRLGLR